MLPKWHVLFGAIFSLLIWIIIPSVGFSGFLIIFLSSFLIDVDHYIYYIYKNKDWNLKKANKWYYKNRGKFFKMSKKEKSKIYLGLCFLHGIEAIIILIFLSFFSNIFLLVVLGFIFHQSLDVIELYKKEISFDKVISFTYALFKARNKKLLQEP